MITADFLRKYNACCDGAKWALSVSPNMSAVWDELVKQGKHEWLLWTATRQGVFTESILRKLACRFVRETPIGDGKTVWDLLEDDRSKKAVEVSERYADGNATTDELSAARAAAWASYATVDSAARVASYAAARVASFSAAWAADAAAFSAARAEADADADACAAAVYAADAAYYAARAAYADSCAAEAAAQSAQIKMIAELCNPFKKGE